MLVIVGLLFVKGLLFTLLIVLVAYISYTLMICHLQSNNLKKLIFCEKKLSKQF
jgi:hypothetical protein